MCDRGSAGVLEGKTQQTLCCGCSNVPTTALAASLSPEGLWPPGYPQCLTFSIYPIKTKSSSSLPAVSTSALACPVLGQGRKA